MNKYVIIIAVSIVSIMALSTFVITDQFATAKTLKKIQFTKTLTSMQDPGQGHESHQLAIILPPELNALYTGSLTFTASQPVQIVILHQIDKEDVKGQPTWTVDGDTVFGLTLVDLDTNSGSYEFTGAAVALHTKDSTKFTATVSVDGWIRGQTAGPEKTQILVEPSLKLSRTNIPVKIPMHKGLYEEKPVYYIITDTTDNTHAKIISEKQKWKVEIAPALSKTPKESVDEVYMFLNGVKGKGIHGFQDEVFSSTPSLIENYSAIRSVVHVTWKDGQKPEILNSTQKILDAKNSNKIVLENTDIIINMPQIVWSDGRIATRTNQTISDDTPYTGGQVLGINTENMTVNFVAHRGWGSDGKTIYYIVTDATPSGPSQIMGVVDAPTLANVATSKAIVDLYQFTNGFKGSGPLGFQAGIASASSGDENYSPLCRISLITWNDPSKATILETMKDINAKKSSGEITVEIAKPMESYHIVNCPFIDPFQ